MNEKLREYAVLGVSRGGRYAVRHKTSGDMFSWRAADAARFSKDELRAIQDEVRALADVRDDGLLQYRDTILHAPTNTLYIVLEHTSWRTLEEIASECRNNSKYVREGFLWYLLHEMARVCKLVYDFNFEVLQKSISASSIYIDDGGAIKIDCFDLAPDVDGKWDIMQQLGRVLNDLCYLRDVENVKVKEFCYSDDLKDVVNFLTDESYREMKPEVVLYHPTVLANLENTMGSKKLTDVLVSADFVENIAESSKCDSEKALEVHNTNEPKLKYSFTLLDSPVYANVSPKIMLSVSDQDVSSAKTSLSPTLAALALELPGFVPRRQTIANNALLRYNEPQQISERTLSNQWLSRLVALRQREETLNRRERDLISKEIVNSPNVKQAILPEPEDVPVRQNNAGITLPPEIRQIVSREQEFMDEKMNLRLSRRNHKRSSSVRTRHRRRQSYSYEDMDSSLSADPGDGSVIVTTTKFSKENMPRRNIFPETSNKKVHFTPVNPFVESDESVTLTFYELENVDGDGYQVPRSQEYTTKKMADEISKFKYLDLEKAALEKRAAMEQWSQSSPNKQPKFTVPANPEKKAFTDITNRDHPLKKTPSKSSINSKTSNTSNGTKYSMSSLKSTLSSDSEKSRASYQSCVSNGSRFSARLKNAEKLSSYQSKPAMRQSMVPTFDKKEDVKKPKSRMSLLPFKTPFKFLSSKT